MNLRQKNKRLKKELERYKETLGYAPVQPVPVIIRPAKIETFRASCVIDPLLPEDKVERLTKKEILYKIGRGIEPYVNFYVLNEPVVGRKHMIGELKVVDG